VASASSTRTCQARQVDRVKKFESGVISDPITVSPDMTIRQVIELTRASTLARKDTGLVLLSGFARVHH
jgi:CBS domain-containing protein